ncbi:predicted protein [Streptomyces viridochromogenes DSM 40736]|uniref:Predicted protein n=1 Tax=Streptomyces viridochromogenes (strain DSM 40736 / JCM 4977 / BCRC 1201 / Tue 494) TaxID=591159 RepID=D9XH34_STRVT|nr:predicted protein [Streptomyces viridochromogenes DSM 40736]
MDGCAHGGLLWERGGQGREAGREGRGDEGQRRGGRKGGGGGKGEIGTVVLLALHSRTRVGSRHRPAPQLTS